MHTSATLSFIFRNFQLIFGASNLDSISLHLSSTSNILIIWQANNTLDAKNMLGLPCWTLTFLSASEILTYFQEDSQNDGDSDDEEGPEISKWESVTWLFVLTVLITVLSEYLVNAIEVT